MTSYEPYTAPIFLHLHTSETSFFWKTLVYIHICKMKDNKLFSLLCHPFSPPPRWLSIECLRRGDYLPASGEGEGDPWCWIVVTWCGGDWDLPALFCLRACVGAAIKTTETTVRTVSVSLSWRPAGGGTVSTLRWRQGGGIGTGASRVREKAFIE